MALKRWLIKKYDKELAKELSEECGVDAFLALLAINRGVSDSLDLDIFLSDDPELEDPFSLCDIDLACDRVLSALENNEKIAIFGDYDCDGVTATALLYSFLKEKGADVCFYIPNRLTEGYGMNIEAIEGLSEKGINLIITVDNGVNAIVEIDRANELGIDVVVTDHHLPQGALPNAVAVVDPHRKDDYSECKNLSGVGVAFKLISALSDDNPLTLLCKYSQIVALGTIGDIVPLLGENRIICKYGLEYINKEPNFGIAALKSVSSADKKEATVSSVSFSLVPRINAAGRMGNSERAVELLLANNAEEAQKLAEELNQENIERQSVCEEITTLACEIIDREELYKNKVICVYGSGWHSGIIGIVASKIVERYNRPSLVFSEEDGIMHGSGRSIEGLNLFEAVSFAERATVTFGGHEMAVGATVRIEDYEEFCSLINEYAQNTPACVSGINLDCCLRPEVITTDLIDVISYLEPYGAGNPEPVFGLFGAVITHIDPLKSGRFIRLTVTRGGYSFSALCFNYNQENFPLSVGNKIDLAFTLELNEFRGAKNVCLFVKQVRPNGIDEENYFGSLLDYEEFCSGNINKENALRILPLREEFAAVFTFVRNARKILTEEAIAFKFHHFGLGKIKVILEAFCSLGILKFVGDDMISGYLVNQTKEKVSLEDAPIIKKIKAYIEEGGELE